MWAFLAHLGTIDKDSLTNIRDVSNVLFSFYFVDERNIDKQEQANSENSGPPLGNKFDLEVGQR